MDSFRHFWMGLSSFGCNDNFYCYVGAVLHSFKAIAFPIPRLSYDLYRFEVKDFKTDMISNELWFKRQKSPFHVSFGVLFFCNHIHPRPSKRSYRTRKKGKNKQTQGSAHLPKSAASLSNKISAGNNKRSERNFMNSPDLSKKLTEVKLKGNRLAQ